MRWKVSGAAGAMDHCSVDRAEDPELENALALVQLALAPFVQRLGTGREDFDGELRRPFDFLRADLLCVAIAIRSGCTRSNCERWTSIGAKYNSARRSRTRTFDAR